MRVLLIIFLISILEMGFSQTNSFIDNRDNQVYRIVEIDSQIWMAENLNTTVFRNGDTILGATTYEEWEKATINKQPAWCYPVKKSQNGEKYGKLYNWYAVNDPRGLAPEGWHISTGSDWEKCIKFIGNKSAQKLCFRGLWGYDKKMFGTDEFGFSIYEVGDISKYGSKGYFGSYFWTNSNPTIEWAWAYSTSDLDDEVVRSPKSKGDGCSVRCVKDIP